MLGRPASWLPVCMKVMAGSWLIASVCIPRTTHHSSDLEAICGISSLNQLPDWPCCLNLKIDGATGKFFWPDVIVVRRWPLRIDSGRSLPRIASSCGFGSKRSICDGAPDWKR